MKPQMVYKWKNGYLIFIKSKYGWYLLIYSFIYLFVHLFLDIHAYICSQKHSKDINVILLTFFSLFTLFLYFFI